MPPAALIVYPMADVILTQERLAVEKGRPVFVEEPECSVVGHIADEFIGTHNFETYLSSFWQ